MPDALRAIYRNGAFVPVVPCNLPEETPVEVIVKTGAVIMPPLEPDPEKRAEIRRQMLKRMRDAPLPADAPKFTREQLHERH